jgi:type IV secretory pathway TrbF-like protein
MSASSMQTALNRTVPLPDEKLGSPHLEIQANYAVHNRYLRIILLSAAVLMLCLVGERIHFAKSIREIRPLVVGIDSTGKASVIPFAALDYKPKEPEIKYFLTEFTKLHFSRIRATAQDSFDRKLFFLSSDLSRLLIDDRHRTQWLVKFLMGEGDEVEVFPTLPSIEDLRGPTYRASVDFETVHRARDGREVKRQKHRVHYVFDFQQQADRGILEVNPLAIRISYFRADEATR